MRPLRLFALLVAPVLTGAWAFQAARPHDASTLRIRSVEHLPEEIDDPAWSQDRPVRLHLSSSFPAAELEVRAAASTNEIAFLIEWRYEGRPSLALQFPLDDSAPCPAVFGDSRSPVRLWTWNPDGGAEEMITTGEESFRASPRLPSSRVRAKAEVRGGRRCVLLRGSLETPLTHGAQRSYSALLWDREGGEDPLRVSASSWQEMSLAEGFPLLPLARAASAVLGALLFQWVLLDAARRFRARC